MVSQLVMAAFNLKSCKCCLCKFKEGSILDFNFIKKWSEDTVLNLITLISFARTTKNFPFVEGRSLLDRMSLKIEFVIS